MRISDWSSDVCSSDLGAQYLVNTVSLPGLEKASENQSALREAFPVKKGDPVDADKIVAAQLELAVALGEKGYPFAEIDEPTVRIAHEDRRGDLSMIVEPGGYRRFGRVVVRNDDIFSDRHITRIARSIGREAWRDRVCTYG